MSDENRDPSEGDASEESSANVMELPALELCEPEGPPPFSDERTAAKEAIRVAFLAGRSTLAASAVKYRIPYETILTWSKREGWAAEREKMAVAVTAKVTESLHDFIAEQKSVQIRRALSRAQKLQTLVDSAAENEAGQENGLLASAVQALASAEERADNIVRRNLGMDSQQSGGSASVNIIAGNVSFS